MPDGLYVTKVEFNALLKKIDYLECYIKNSLAERNKSKWLSQREAMELVGCKMTKLFELRLSGALHWKTSGKGKGIMILRKSVDDNNDQNSTLG